MPPSAGLNAARARLGSAYLRMVRRLRRAKGVCTPFNEVDDAWLKPLHRASLRSTLHYCCHGPQVCQCCLRCVQQAQAKIERADDVG